MTLCDECKDLPGNYQQQRECNRCGRFIVKYSKSNLLRYRILDVLKFHKHDYKIVASGNIKTRHGQFTIALLKCSKCPARDWVLKGLIEEVEAWEREQEII